MWLDCLEIDMGQCLSTLENPFDLFSPQERLERPKKDNSWVGYEPGLFVVAGMYWIEEHINAYFK